MFKFTALRQAVQEIDAPGIPPSWNLPVQYDATLVPGLVAEHDELDARFALQSGEIRRLFLLLEQAFKLSKADS